MSNKNTYTDDGVTTTTGGGSTGVGDGRGGIDNSPIDDGPDYKEN